jgi:hypothetical protein
MRSIPLPGFTTVFSAPGEQLRFSGVREIIPVVRDKSGLGEVILAGDRGSVTQVRIRQLQALPGAGWITALRAPAIPGALQLLCPGRCPGLRPD